MTLPPRPLPIRADRAPDFTLPDGPNLIERITGDDQFAAIVDYFSDNPAAQRSLVSPDSQALLYCLIRVLKPSHVIEIGIYYCGTSEAICRALAANNAPAKLHGIEPFTAQPCRDIVSQWPDELSHFMTIYDETSMRFFMEIKKRHIRPSLVFIDGDHSLEFAGFDLAASARELNPAGYIVMDNVSQPGPFLAAKDFLAANPSWTVEIRDLPAATRGYDKHRPTVRKTDFVVLRAPSHQVADRRPRSFGPSHWSWFVSGITLKLAEPVTETGHLSAQVILRGYGAVLAEKVFEIDVRLTVGSRGLTIPVTDLVFNDSFNSYTVEIVLCWSGKALLLAEPPLPLGRPQ